MKPLALFLLLALLLPDKAAAESPSPQQAAQALRNASAFLESISTNGGYAGIYSLDLQKRYGEGFYEPMKSTEIWVQPPGTPAVGECFLRAYLVTGADSYLKSAREAGRALAWGQRKAGGWDHLADVASMSPGSVKPERKKGACAFDDNITQGALSFLISLDAVVEEEWLSEAIQLGLNHMMRSQFPNGAWPQWYPLKWWHPLIERYHDYYTFNDGAINDCIKVMLKAHKAYRKDEYLQSACRGGDFIIASQLPGAQAGWAQQYSHDMKPAWARSFEPPGVSSAATARNIRTLLDLHLHMRNERYLAPIPKAIAWLNKSKIGENRWARLYELGSNKPIYGDTDGKVHYTLAEISEERKSGYGWQGEFGVTSAIKYYGEVKALGAALYLARQAQPTSSTDQNQMAERLAEDVQKVIGGLDARGRWVENNMIYTGAFVENMNLLCDFLELVKSGEQ